MCRSDNQIGLRGCQYSIYPGTGSPGIFVAFSIMDKESENKLIFLLKSIENVHGFWYDMIQNTFGGAGCPVEVSFRKGYVQKMNLNQLYYFVTLAETEHYSRAAEILSITQPSLSHAIARLEEELGAELFEKRGRNVVLTKYGKVFLEHARESLQSLEVGIKKTKALTGKNSGVIDLAYIYTLGLEFVPRLVRQFMEEHPQLNVQFRFTVGNTIEIIRGLKEEKYDVAFCSRKEEEKQMIFEPVAEEKLVVVVAKNHPLAQKDRISLKETADFPQIFFNRSSGLRPTIVKMFDMAGIAPKIAYEIEEDSAMAGLVAGNFGIAVMPEVPVLKYLDVKTLNITEPVIERYIYMAQLKGQYQPPVLKKFLDYVQNQQLKK